MRARDLPNVAQVARDAGLQPGFFLGIAVGRFFLGDLRAGGTYPLLSLVNKLFMNATKTETLLTALLPCGRGSSS